MVITLPARPLVWQSKQPQTVAFPPIQETYTTSNILPYILLCYSVLFATNLTLYSLFFDSSFWGSDPVLFLRDFHVAAPSRMSVDGNAVDNGAPGSVSTQDSILESPYIKLATYNIQSGRGGRLEMALREMAIMNIDAGILTETKLTDGIYTRFSSFAIRLHGLGWHGCA